jgi:hypothetical protein
MSIGKMGKTVGDWRGGDIADDSDAFKQLADGICPECGHRGFVLGPRGGASINVECGNRVCAARYNLVTFGWELVSAQRI